MIRSEPAELALTEQLLTDELDVHCTPRTKEEILKALKKMKCKKAPEKGHHHQ